MNQTLILFPAFAMFFMTMGLLMRMGLARYRAASQQRVDFRYYQLYRDGEEPADLRKLSRHVQNHFEVPPLFYAGVLIAFVTGAVNLWTLGFAWAFVAARALHSFIHLGSNIVIRRFQAFGLGLFMLTGLWVSVLVALL